MHNQHTAREPAFEGGHKLALLPRREKDKKDFVQEIQVLLVPAKMSVILCRNRKSLLHGLLILSKDLFESSAHKQNSPLDTIIGVA